MKKKVKDFKVNYSLDLNGRLTEINQLRKHLDEAEALGATHIKVDAEEDYELLVVRTTVISRRLETDEEFEKRVEDHNYRKLTKEWEERRTLEALKKKYDK